MMTRDSNVWWWVMGGGIIVALSSHLDLIDPLMPKEWHQSAHAFIELLAFLVTTGAGIARMSPLPISHEGRMEAIQAKGEQMSGASVAAAVASIKADEAVKATSEAADAANVAKDVSAKAGDL